MTIQHEESSSEMSDGEIVPSVCLSGSFNANIDKYCVKSEPNGCVLSKENQIQTMAAISDEMLVNQNTYIVENSNDVVIGPVTHFHCPVTIIQGAQDNGSFKDALEDIPDLNNSNQSRNSQTCSDEDSTLSKSQISQAQQDIQNDSTKDPPETLVYAQKRRKLLKFLLVGITVICLGITTTLAIVFMHTNTKHVYVRIDDTKNDTLTEEPYEPENPYDPSANEPQWIPRSKWGARPPLSVRKLETPVKYLVVAHTQGRYCKTFETCAGIMQSLQSIAVENKSPDIGYNFLIGGDGNIYVGRGWEAINYLRNHCISVSFIGNYSYDDFTAKMQKALEKLINTGINEGYLREDYYLLSHSQTTATLSPGIKVRSVIQTWPHYYPGDYIKIPQ